MIVFDLKCSHGHIFEAWFGSSPDYEAQKARGLVACPSCGDPDVDKAVMAPAVAPKGNRRPNPVPAPAGEPAVPVAAMSPEDTAKLRTMMRKLAEVQAEALQNSSWVGGAFADRARAMHYGEEPTQSIHGTAGIEEAQALLEEGIAVAPLPLPIVPPGEAN